ncbi:MAG: ThiF family adenylyltransferase [Candidatus Heimdallarchaeota archaeon]|nr:MAG: ThiF family adenylyltransferase [Candidatus Heimdallarchaeota archaeon]
MSNVSDFTSEEFTDEEKRRFDRQFRLPGWKQETLKRSTVLIVGIGGLGVEVAKNLAMVSVGKLILVDLDTVEYSNLNRQVLFIGAPEGVSKAEFAAKRLREMNPFISIEAYNCALQNLPPRLYQEADLFIAGLDSIEARSELNRRAVHNHKPLIDAGTAAYNGHVYCMFPFSNACLECDPLTEREQDQLGACTLVGVPRKPAHCILKGQLQFEQDHGRPVDILKPKEISAVREYANTLLKAYFPESQPFSTDQVIQIVDNHEATVITINCVMASLQSQEAVKILHHIHTPKNEKKLGSLQLNYVIYNGLTGKFYEMEKPRNSNCTMCGNTRAPLYRIKVKPNFLLKKIVTKLAQEKKYLIDPDFPPSIFRIDTSEVNEIDWKLNLSEAKLRNYETILVTGFEDGTQIYLSLKFI